MEANDSNIKDKQEESDKPKEIMLPLSTRLLVSIPFGLLILCILLVYTYVIIWDPDYIDPNNIGLSQLLLIAIVIIIIVNIPWHSLGFRIKKIGSVKFGNYANSNQTELADLQKEIEELKKVILSDTSSSSRQDKIDKMILEFLSQNRNKAYSATRIRSLANTSSVIRELRDTDLEIIRGSLRRLLSKGDLETRISKKGNTIYTIAKKTKP